MGRKIRPSHSTVSATELAEMGYCEQRVLLTHLMGERTTAEQQQARQRGVRAHDIYYVQGKAAASDGRCFVASCVFGRDASETQILRVVRDQVLRRHGWGRALVCVYYAVAPAVCKVLVRSPAMTSIMRCVLRQVVRIWQWLSTRMRT